MSSEHGLKHFRLYALVLGCLIVFGAWTAYWRSHFAQVELPPALTTIEDFTLTDQDGRSVSSGELRGSTLIVNFIFTSCPDVCPLLTQKMARIQRELGSQARNIRLLSISVDPDRDTPQALKSFALAHGAKLTNWSFLTGPIDTLSRVVVKGFRIYVQNSSLDPSTKSVASEGAVAPANLMQITHGEHFVVVDALGQIRAYQTAGNDQEIRQIASLARLLSTTSQEILRAR
jgi:protein SCO1/2